VFTQREADEAQINQQVARIAEGIRARDLESLRPIYATDVVSFDVEPPLEHVGIQASVPFDVLSGRGVVDLEP
jgi:ketosteroid isomerase-like protein